MLAIASTGASGRQPIDVRKLVESGDWVLDLKLDGIRAILDDYSGRIWTRTGTDIADKFPEIRMGSWASSLFDGEIIAKDGTFETALMRESQSSKAKINRLAESHPCMFVAFDMPMAPGDWTSRRRTLEVLTESRTPLGHDAQFIDAVRHARGEGVIAKRRASRYQPGKRSADWVKWKDTSRTTCIAYGYEPGTGSRTHFGSLKLALINDDGSVQHIGRTGSGFTERQTWELKNRLDSGEMFAVEVEHMRTLAGELRFPVFRGVRRDKTLLDCTIDQLEE
ncbi:ATP-dependent DNA ligase [Nocardioides maradonensis]